ncbi:MAG: glycoside hydrolase family 2 protein, partial [Bacteroidota bacterium]
VQEKDDEGRSFIIEVNGVRVFCKGADWIPCDAFLPRTPDSTYEKLLTMAQQAGMNMIRVWGGGVYERDCFYDMCDELGLMVWQDFMFACGEYPEEQWFLNQVEDEAQKTVRRLRNHPSIVLWCGNNECEWNFCKENPGKSPEEMSGARIFRDLLPSVVRRLDGTRPYWRSSPFGSGFPNDESNGNYHGWNVWGSWLDFPEYEKSRARFVTEFGFQAPANEATFQSVTILEDRRPQSTVMEHHNKLGEGTERLFRFQAAHYVVATDFAGFIENGQLVQAEALKTAAEHWRRRKFRTAGVLFWQLNDCWPVSSWSVIDSGLRPKAAYFFAKRFFAPVLVSMQREFGSVDVWGTNDTLQPIGGMLECSLLSFEGRQLWSKSTRVVLPRNGSKKLIGVKIQKVDHVDPHRTYLRVRFAPETGPALVNRLFFAEPKHLQLPVPTIRTVVKKLTEGKFVVKLESGSFAKNVRLTVEGIDVEMSDNHFDLDPGEHVEVELRSYISLFRLRRLLRISWLGK